MRDRDYVQSQAKRRQWLPEARWHVKPSRIPNEKTSRVRKPSENRQTDPRRHWPPHNPGHRSADPFDLKGASGPGTVEEGETSWHMEWRFQTLNLSTNRRDFTVIMQHRDVPGSSLNWAINYTSVRPSGRRLKLANDLIR